MRRLIFFILFLLHASLALAQVRGTIPQKYVNRPATDLVKDGKVLLPEEAHDLFIRSRQRLDLSTLNPAEDTDIWKNVYPARIDEEKLDNLPVDETSTVEYDSNVLSRTGNYRFNVTSINEFGVPEIFTMLISKNAHSMLMTKSLLRKIGYNVPSMKWLPKVQIKFKTEEEKKAFVRYIELEAMAGDAENWVVEDYGDNVLLVQDVVVMEGNPLIYNLAMGPITNEITGGRRLMNSLVIPLTLTNVPESINMLKWSMGNVTDGMVALDLDYANEFDCSWEDARWIGRRIEKMSRSDWQDVVASSHVPKAVQMVILEKLISRRNNLMKLLQIDAVMLKVEEGLNHGADVVDGKIIKERWDGYATRFAFGDPDSPLSDAEMTSWIKSKAMQSFIDGAVSSVNSLKYLGTDINSINAGKYQEFVDTYLQNQMENPNEPLHIPIKGWVFPTFRGNLVLTRNITTGAYLGTDNMVNLVDAIGVSLEAGVFMGTAGLPNPIFASAGAAASVTRVYAHLRPVTTLTKALKYPFKNILVPIVKKEYGKQLSDILALNLDALSEEERKAKLKEALAPFKKDMEIGESLIVTDTLLVGGALRVGANMAYMMKAQLGIAPGQIVVGRFHIHRRSEDVVQIYRDFGNVRSITISFGLNSFLPIVKVGMKASAGTAKTKFFSLNINHENKNSLEQITYLKDALMHSSLKKLEKANKPWVIEHAFKEQERKVGIFFWRWNKVNSHTDMSLTHPTGAKRNFFRAYSGQNKGRDYQDFAFEAVRNWLALFADFDYTPTTTSSNPGQTFKGSARNKVVVYEGENTAQGVVQPFMRLSRIWNGWEVDRAKAKDILNEILHRYRFEFFEPTVLNDTVKIFLYSISVNVLVYDRGVEHMATLAEEEVKKIFGRHAMRADLRVKPTNEEENENAANGFLSIRRKWIAARTKKDLIDASELAMKALTEAEEKLNVEGLRSLLGGERNFYVNSKIDGYRAGDENGDRALISNSFGEFGRREVLGPLQNIQQQSEMLEGEFFIYWIMTRLI